MKYGMMKIKLNDILKQQGRSLYWLNSVTDIPYNTLWNISKKGSQESINLTILSKLCAVLKCNAAAILEHELDDEDKAMLALIDARDKKAAKPATDAPAKAAKKGKR